MDVDVRVLTGVPFTPTDSGIVDLRDTEEALQVAVAKLAELLR
jgi:hypothetical protein